MTLDFACKKFNLEEVIRCSFNLSKGEFSILKTLLSNKKYFSTQELEDLTALDRSTVQRGVKKLYESQLLERSQINLNGGGYQFSYKIKSKNEIRQKIILVIQNWSKRVQEEFDNW